MAHVFDGNPGQAARDASNPWAGAGTAREP